MARRTRAAKLENRTSRLKLPVRRKPVFVKIGRGLGLGYRRNTTAGTWVVRVADGKGGNWTRAIGTADDNEDADGSSVLDYWQAQDKARAVAHHSPVGPITIAKALDEYEANLKVRSGDVANVRRVRAHLPEPLARVSVAAVTARDLRAWRDGLAKKLAPSTVNRTVTALKAALNLAADHDERITSRNAWKTGLAAIPDAQEARNVILPEATVRRIVAVADEESAEFGLLVAVAAVTGARVSQLARLEVQDLQNGRSDPRLMMLSSKKGRGQKKILRRPVPIQPNLAARLCTAARGRIGTERLLVKPDDTPWGRTDHSARFVRVVRRAGLDPAIVTIYALRHSNIVRQLLGNVPVRIVAANHDTSVMMIERTYSRWRSRRRSGATGSPRHPRRRTHRHRRTVAGIAAGNSRSYIKAHCTARCSNIQCA